MIPNNWGWWQVTWPDGTTTISDPATDPLLVTVPAGMSAGTASVVLVSDDGVVFPFCDTTFAIAEDANIPVIDPVMGLGILGFAGVGYLLKVTLFSKQTANV